MRPMTVYRYGAGQQWPLDVEGPCPHLLLTPTHVQACVPCLIVIGMHFPQVGLRAQVVGCSRLG